MDFRSAIKSDLKVVFLATIIMTIWFWLRPPAEWIYSQYEWLYAVIVVGVIFVGFTKRNLFTMIPKWLNRRKQRTPTKTDDRVEAIDKLVFFHIDLGYSGGKKISEGWGNEAIEAAKLGASKKMIERLVSSCIKYGGLYEAIEAVKLADRELTTKEIWTLLKAIHKNQRS